MTDLVAPRAPSVLRVGRRFLVACWCITVPTISDVALELAAQTARSHGTRAGQGHLLRLDDLFANQSILDVAIAPNGEAAAVVIRRPMTVGVERYGWIAGLGFSLTDIWIVPRRGAPERITHGAIDGAWYWRPVWSPDSRRLALLSTRGGDNVRLYVWTTGTKRLRRMSNRGVRLEAMFGEGGPPMAWTSPTELLCVFLPFGEAPLQFAMGPVRRLLQDRAWARTVHGAEPSVSAVDGGISVPESARPQGELSRVDVRTARTRALAQANVRSVALSPDRRRAAIVAEAGNIVRRPDRMTQWPDDLLNEPHLHLGVHRRLAVVSLDHPWTVQWVDGLFDPYFARASASWADDGASFVVMSHANQDPDSRLTPRLVSSDGREIGSARDSVFAPLRLAPQPHFAIPAGLELRGWSQTTGFAVFISEPSDGTILWTRDNARDQPRAQLKLNSHLRRVADDVGTDLLITYAGWDRKTYKGRVTLPAGYEPGKRYPLIVVVYPGHVVRDTILPRERHKPHDNLVAFLEPRLLAVHGYAVLQPTIPPSEGEPIVSMPGFVMPAVDTLVSSGIADSTKLGLLGHSHGAIAVYGLLTLTTRFRAAVAISGWSDILHYYGSSFASYFSDFAHEWATTGIPNFEATNSQFQGLWIGATPWAEPERWMRNNPIYHFDRIETPLMIVRSDNDAFSISDGDVAFQSLHRLGKPVRYVRYWGEPHTIDSPGNIRDLWTRVYSWFDQHLLN